MLTIIANALITLFEKELLNHSPEVQQLMINQVDKLSKILFDYVQGKMLDLVNDEKPKLAIDPNDPNNESRN